MNIALFKGDFDNMNIEQNKKYVILTVKKLGIYMINSKKSDIILLDKFSKGINFDENWIEYNTGTNSELIGKLYLIQ